jgi:hypothetical protein
MEAPSLVMTHDPASGTNLFWDFGDNTFGEMGITPTVGIGNTTSNLNSCGSEEFVSIPTNVQFCTRCQREVQLGTNGSFTAQCNGTLYLYFNTAFSNFVSSFTSGAYTATVANLTNNVVVMGTNYAGIAVGTVTNGGVYSYSATGACVYDRRDDLADANGVDLVTTNQVICVPTYDNNYFNQINSVCPSLKCFSLVGRIQ